MKVELTGKRALVTGGNSGIGAAIARTFARAGADVVVNYHSRPEDAEALAREIRVAGRRAMPIEADVADAESVRAMFGRIEREWGPLDILVNNAGIDGERAPCAEIALEDWRKVIEINLMGTFHCMRLALQGMVERGRGVVLNITSVHETIPWAGHSAYTAAKAGVSMLSKTAAQETARHGVRVLCLAPGAIRTKINEDVWRDPEGQADLKAKIPANRMGDADEIARIALMLCADESAYLLGTSVYVDGGMLLYPSFEKGG